MADQIEDRAGRINPSRADLWLERLRANGYRLTVPRQAVVRVMAASQRVLSPLDIYDLVHASHPGLGLVTVYRTLEVLEELGLLQRVHRPSGCQGFIGVSCGHQHLLICQKCGLIEAFDGEKEQLESLISEVEAATGYTVCGHWLQLFGLCADCKSSS